MPEPTTTTDKGADGAEPLEQPGAGGTQDQPGAGTQSQVDWEARAKQLQEREEVWKAQIAEAKDAKERLAQIEAERASSPATRSDDSEARRYEERRMRLEAAVQAGDPAAEAALEALEENRVLREEMKATKRDLLAMRQIDKLDDGDQVLEHIKKNPGKFNDVETARRDLLAPKLQSENERLRAEVESLRRKPDDQVLNAPPTHGRETTARGNNVRTMSEADFDAELEHLESTQGRLAALKRQQELNEGKIRLK